MQIQIDDKSIELIGEYYRHVGTLISMSGISNSEDYDLLQVNIGYYRQIPNEYIIWTEDGDKYVTVLREAQFCGGPTDGH